MTLRPPKPDSGWFDDPTGRNQRRYWDGANWTEHVQRRDGQQSVDPVSESVSHASLGAAGGQSLSPRRRLKITVVVCILIMITAGVSNYLLSGDQESNERGNLNLETTQSTEPVAEASLDLDDSISRATPIPSMQLRRFSHGEIELEFPRRNGVVPTKIGPKQQEDTFLETVVKIPIAVANFTDEPIHGVTVTAIARTSSGALADGSEEMTVHPHTLEPDTWGVGILEIKNVNLGDVATLEYEVDYQANPCSLFCPVYAQVTEWEFTSDTGPSPGIRGIAKAPASMSFSYASVFCFDEVGQVRTVLTDLLADDSLGGGQSSVFVLENTVEKPCRSFVGYVRGF